MEMLLQKKCAGYLLMIVNINMGKIWEAENTDFQKNLMRSVKSTYIRLFSHDSSKDMFIAYIYGNISNFQICQIIAAEKISKFSIKTAFSHIFVTFSAEMLNLWYKS